MAGTECAEIFYCRSEPESTRRKCDCSRRSFGDHPEPYADSGVNRWSGDTRDTGGQRSESCKCICATGRDAFSRNAGSFNAGCFNPDRYSSAWWNCGDCALYGRTRCKRSS